MTAKPPSESLLPPVVSLLHPLTMVTEWSRDGHNRPGFEGMAARSAPASAVTVMGSPGYVVTRREAANQSSEPRVGSSDLAGAAKQPRIRKRGVALSTSLASVKPAEKAVG